MRRRASGKSNGGRDRSQQLSWNPTVMKALRATRMPGGNHFQIRNRSMYTFSLEITQGSARVEGVYLTVRGRYHCFILADTLQRCSSPTHALRADLGQHFKLYTPKSTQFTFSRQLQPELGSLKQILGQCSRRRSLTKQKSLIGGWCDHRVGAAISSYHDAR